MNKRGQTLILFVILIPVILLLLAVLVDTGICISKKTQMKEITKHVMNDLFLGSDTEIKEYLEKNQIQTDQLKIIRTDHSLEIENEVDINSIFGSIVGIKQYHIKIHMKCIKEDNRIKFL